jgi:hypothetical protein
VPPIHGVSLRAPIKHYAMLDKDKAIDKGMKQHRSAAQDLGG